MSRPKVEGSTHPNWEVLKAHLYKEGRVTKEHCKRILRDTLGLISKKTATNNPNRERTELAKFV